FFFLLFLCFGFFCGVVLVFFFGFCVFVWVGCVFGGGGVWVGVGFVVGFLVWVGCGLGCWGWVWDLWVVGGIGVWVGVGVGGGLGGG
ncbi:hypothetical protein, partial [Klebsiella pneumoniae]|uniref:hypothetical protein n=1 Tax=Klebsiella pneumoniae TaxID=573 RepID=UPI001C4EB083